MRMSNRWLIANGLWLQAGWWGCVLGARWPWLLLVVPCGLALHLWHCPRRGEEVRALMRVAAAGCLLDSLLGALGVFRFAQWPLPLWLALLWLVFASGLRHCLAWAAHPGWRAAMLGLVAGPSTYLAGAGLAGVDLPLGSCGTALLLAPVWALALPLALRLAL